MALKSNVKRITRSKINSYLDTVNTDPEKPEKSLFKTRTG
jgi:hypothetical protein